MRGDFRRYWRDPDYWRYLWEDRLSGGAKAAMAVMACVAAFFGGLWASGTLSPDLEPVTLVKERLLTVTREVDGETITQVTAVPVRTITEEGETRLQTVVRDGETVVETITDTVRLQGKVVTDTRTLTDTDTVVKTRTERDTSTQTQTETVDRPTTLTETQTLDRVTTETRDPQRPRTGANDDRDRDSDRDGNGDRDGDRHRREGAGATVSEFWKIVNANWTYEEINMLARMWKAFEDARLGK